MMTNNNETVMEVDCQEEYILYDVLDVIFSHLTIKSLCHVALVSRSWNHAAKREMAKRKTLHRVLLPVLYDKQGSKLDLADYFNVKPSTVLMFCGPRPNMRPVLSLEYKIMEEYYKRLPGRIVMLGVEQVMKDEEEVRSCNMMWLCKSNTPMIFNNILGISLPNSPDFTIKVVECVSQERNIKKNANKIFDQLHESADQLDNPVFLLFSRYDYTVGSHVMRMFQEKYADKAINVWGSTISDFIKRSDDGFPKYCGTHGFLGILLHAPRLNSHCLVLPIDHDDIMTMKLADFRRSFKLKRYSLGFVCGPRQFVLVDKKNLTTKYYCAEDFMKLVKMEFSNVEFTGMFNNRDFHYYGCDHTSKTGHYNLQHKDALSIMILTYN